MKPPIIFPLTICVASLSAQSLELEITTPRDEATPKVVISGTAQNDENHLLHFSSDALNWFPVSSSPSLPWEFEEKGQLRKERGFYRALRTPLIDITPHSTWKSNVTLPKDPFASEPILTSYDQAEIRWIKFAIILDNAPAVYFQDSEEYQFHYNFATNRLAPFTGNSLEEFNSATLFPPKQDAVLGALLFAPKLKEFAFEFVGREAYPPEMLRYLYQIVDASVQRPDDWAGFYFPTFEQSESAQDHADFFSQSQIAIGNVARWQNTDACYSPGWALGRLVYVPGSEIAEAFRKGDLRSDDILITDGVPAEIPYVAGIISTTPGTPNSHVAILARSYGVPFVYLSNQTDVDSALSNLGQDVVLRANSEYSGVCKVDTFLAKDVTPEYRETILELKQTPPLDFTPREKFGAATMEVATASLSDLPYIGGKAANFSLLRKTIPESSPKALAFTFDLWDGFLNQQVDGSSLQEKIANRLSSHTWPPNIAELDEDLRQIRDLIKKEADFSSNQKSAILSALQSFGFDPKMKLRFRSSTNVEDSDQFVGAGLYDSYSGCLMDDLDADDDGPSHCDPSKENERGVFRAMRKVYASFYNLNAYLERLRRGVDETQVGMAILVHHSFPDELEAANGVVSGRFQPSGNNFFLFSEIVTQLGAFSVTNPDGKSIPELVESNCYQSSSGTSCSNFFQERSSLLPLGNFSIMAWEDEYSALSSMALEVALAYQKATKIERFNLEFEFKKLTGDSLVIKQVRRIPEVAPSGSKFPALVNKPVTLEVFQGEAADLFSNHNLKLHLDVESDSRMLNPSGLTTSFLSKTNWLRHDSGKISGKNGKIPDWNASLFEVRDLFGNDYAVDSWTEPMFKNGKTDLELRIQMPSDFSLKSQPIQVVGDLRTEFHATFSAPQFTRTYRDGFTTTTSQVVILVPSVTDQPLPSGSTKQTRTHQTKSGTDVEINFYWPPSPTGPIAGYTAPLQKWDVTKISGLTSKPIELRGYFSQTYRPGHHNFTEEYLFEPQLEEGIDEATLAELKALDIKQFYLEFGGLVPDFKAIGFDNEVRSLN